MKKADKNDVDFREMKRQFENDCLDLAKQIKKFIKERELLHLYINYYYLHFLYCYHYISNIHYHSIV